MDNVANRRARLKQWFEKRTLPEKEKSYLSQLIRGKASFGEKAARRLERDYDMPAGYLDTPLGEEAQGDAQPTISKEEAEILSYWAYLLPNEKKEVLERVRSLAVHNRLVMEQLSESVRVVRVSDRRKKPFGLDAITTITKNTKER